MKPEIKRLIDEAEKCQQMAANATTQDVKLAWLRLANEWLRLVPAHALREPNGGKNSGDRK